MKLLQKHPDGSLTVVEHPAGVNLRGVMDAFEVAQHAGDGTYIADMMDGSYLPFAIVDGQMPQGADFDVQQSMQYGQPYNKTAEGQRFGQGQESNSFPSLVPDVAGAEHQDGGAAFEDYIPASQRG